jgi:hypothetical protein
MPITVLYEGYAMGIFETLFGKKKRDTAAPKKVAAKSAASGPRGDSASAKEVVRYIFDQLAKGTAREAVRQDLKSRGFSSQSANDYIELVEKTMFKRGGS